MPCPSCGTNNPPEANFCQNCGTDLRVTCPECETVNPAAARFCMNCGHRFAAAPEPEPVPRAAPPPTRQAESDGERRVVTILFVDVKGSTSLAEQVDPEVWTEIIDGAFRKLIPAVTRYDGTVARLMGDALLALFGAPTAHEDDAYRAVLAALDMLEDHKPYREAALQQLRARGAAPEPDDFQVRVGISTGLVVVGTVGSEEKQEYTAMGDPINLAARMEQSAAPGTIQIAHDTYRLLSDQVEAEPLGELALKGKSRPVRVYRVTGLRRPSPSARGVSSLSAPLIGRDAEMALVRDHLDRLEAGQGQILCVIGEAGLGKSRLLAEARALAAGRDLLWVEAASLSYEGNHPYGLVRHLLRSVCGCAPDDPPEVVRGKAAALVEGRPPEEQRAVSRLVEVLFTQGDAWSDTPADEGQEQLHAGAEAIWRNRAGSGPLVVVLEDLHWTDSASIDLIRHLFHLVDRAPILFLCLFRPSRQAPVWGLKQAAERDYGRRFTEIDLGPLSLEDSNRLVANLLESTDLPGRIVRLILDKAEGNPFFVEEIVGELIESGAVTREDQAAGWRLAVPVEDVRLPESLEALLVARMDRLEEQARQTLQMAAVIGRSFLLQVLEMIADHREKIETHLAALERSGMIVEAPGAPDREYMFRHALTQEAAYNTMLFRRRRIYHQRTGEVIEKLFADRLEEQAALLAHHFYRAGSPERALRYATMAAEHAARLHANFEAITHYDGALAIAGDMSKYQTTAGQDAVAPLAEARIGLLRGRATIYGKLGDFDRALADLEAAMAAAEELGNRRDVWQILLDLGQLWASRDYERAGHYYEESLAIAREIKEPDVLAASLNRVGNWHANQERPRRGIGFHLEALELLDGSGDERSLAGTIDLLGMANIIGGDLQAGRRYYQRAVELFERLDDRFGLASALTTLAYRGPITRNSYLETDLATALENGERALDLAREIGWRAGESYACFSLSSLLTAMGQFDRALALGKLALDIATDIQHRQWMAGARVTLGQLYADLLQWDLVEEHQREAVRLGLEVRSRNWHYTASSMLAFCHMQRGLIDEAAELLDELGGFSPSTDSLSSRNYWWALAELSIRKEQPQAALDICERLVSANDLPEGAVIPALWKTRAAAHALLGEFEEAVRLLRQAVDRCEQTGERSLVWYVLADLGHDLRRAGDAAGGEAALGDALDRAETLAGTIPNESLRSAFLEAVREKLVANET